MIRCNSQAPPASSAPSGSAVSARDRSALQVVDSNRSMARECVEVRIRVEDRHIVADSDCGYQAVDELADCCAALTAGPINGKQLFVCAGGLFRNHRITRPPTPAPALLPVNPCVRYTAVPLAWVYLLSSFGLGPGVPEDSENPALSGSGTQTSICSTGPSPRALTRVDFFMQPRREICRSSTGYFGLDTFLSPGIFLLCILESKQRS